MHGDCAGYDAAPAVSEDSHSGYVCPECEAGGAAANGAAARKAKRQQVMVLLASLGKRRRPAPL